MKKISFYITGHGFGHASRIIEVINHLLIKEPLLLPIINSVAPEWLFRRGLANPFQYLRRENDIGAVQKDWRKVDKLETLKRYAELIKTEPEFVREQAGLIRREQVSAVVSDIPAVAFLIARAAGTPSFGITNFSWDWIYAPYLEDYPDYRFVVEHIRECYSRADRLLRLPFCGDLSAFPVIEDIPLVARLATLEKDEVRQRLGLDEGRKIVLIYLGEFDYRKVLSEEMLRRKEYVFGSFESLRAPGLSSQDIVKGADVVVAKPGYGIVSDCIANHTPILYTSREDFVEYHALVEGVKQCGAGRFLPLEDLLAGRWLSYLEGQLASEQRRPPVATNGAEVAADKILKAL